MKIRWPRIMTGLAFASCLAMLAPACVVRARGKVRTRAVIVVDDTNPPPKPRYVTVQPRAGYVWVRGHWEYTGARWVWMDGRWEREQRGKRWEPGHWERRGNRHHWVAGHWVTVSAGGGVVRDHRNNRPDPAPTGHVRDHRAPPVAAYPTQAPPPPQAENQAARAGYIWVSGRWDWKGGKWAWTAGHWERAKANHNWVTGRWEHKGDRYVWVEGRWEAAPAGNVRDHRKKNVAPEPPPVKNEKVKARRP